MSRLRSDTAHSTRQCAHLPSIASSPWFPPALAVAPSPNAEDPSQSPSHPPATPRLPCHHRRPTCHALLPSPSRVTSSTSAPRCFASPIVLSLARPFLFSSATPHAREDGEAVDPPLPRRMPEKTGKRWIPLKANPDIMNQADNISGFHFNTHIAVVIGVLHLFFWQPENLNLNFLREHNQMSSSGGKYTSSKGTTEREFKILNLLAFNSKRKRMPVILKDEYGQILLLCKRSNSSLFQPSSIMFDGLAKSGSLFEPDISNHFNEYSEAGLRTLALTYRVLEESECSSWNVDFLKAETSIEPNKRIATLASLRFD